MGRIVELPSIKPRSTSRRQGLRKLSPDLISKARDETATQVTRIGLTFLRSAPYGSRVGQLCGHLGDAITDDDAAQVKLHCASTPSAAARRRCPIAGPRVTPSTPAQLGHLKLELVYRYRELVATFLP